VSDDLKEVFEAYRTSHHAGVRSITQIADSNARGRCTLCDERHWDNKENKAHL
jgi:hypothetical protein